ncbi:MAG: SSI family serine proteinase inhibitor [Nocardiopsaceae bacterium]|nr:SSI family serine proteinase inhibitor [Nocardiopsaceae bacterium]
MRNRQVPTIIAALAASGVGGLIATPAAHAEETPLGVLELVIEHQADTDKTAAVRLECDPTGGSHPGAEAACSALKEVDGEFAELPTRDDVCTMDYRPVMVRATGQWRGEPVYYEDIFANTCAAGAETNGVFALSR